MEKDNSQLRAALISLLQEEVTCARALYQSLRCECAALSSVDEKLITINSANKQKLIDTLQLASDARIGFMEEHGVTSNPAAIKEHIISSDYNAEINTLFIQLSEIAQQCFSENSLIGQLINRRTQFISQTLSSLSPSQTPNSPTYGENGSIVNRQDSSHSLFHLANI